MSDFIVLRTMWCDVMFQINQLLGSWKWYILKLIGLKKEILMLLQERKKQIITLVFYWSKALCFALAANPVCRLINTTIWKMLLFVHVVICVNNALLKIMSSRENWSRLMYHADGKGKKQERSYHYQMGRHSFKIKTSFCSSSKQQTIHLRQSYAMSKIYWCF